MKKEISIAAIENGTVIDHVPSEVTFQVAEILNVDKLPSSASVATNLYSKKLKRKGIIKIEDKYLTTEEVNKIAIIAPKASVSKIENYKVTKKDKVSIPDKVERIVKCSNPNCITNKEPVETKFAVQQKEPLQLECEYCERSMSKDDIVLL